MSSEFKEIFAEVIVFFFSIIAVYLALSLGACFVNLSNEFNIFEWPHVGRALLVVLSIIFYSFISFC